jgi:DNA processing protein
MRLSMETMVEEYGLKKSVAENWVVGREGRLEVAKRLAEQMEAQGVRLVTLADASYPSLLESIDPDPPGVLYLYGQAWLLDGRTFAVLSSRKSSEDSLRQIEALAEQGVLNGEILVAGHDTPEYQRSAVVPLRWGAPRILVLDQGMKKVLGADLKEEAFRIARLWRFQFDPTTDLVVATQPPDGAYHGNSNKVRDRLVAGLSRRLDLVEASPGGNMSLLGRRALGSGRPVRVTDKVHDHQRWQESGAGLISI